MWENVARDRVSMQTLLRLVRVDRTDLTVLLLHAPDKVEHVTWGAVQDAPGEPLHRDVLERQAERWTGPVTGPAPWSFGNVAGAYLEVDAFLGELLVRAHYDYVVLVSDHGMTRNLGPGLAGLHGPAHPEAHRGILLLHGRDVRRGGSLGTVSVLDVAPTLAYMLDLPIARDLPGRFLEEAFHRGARRRARQVESWSGPLPARWPGGDPPRGPRGPRHGAPDPAL